MIDVTIPFTDTADPTLVVRRWLVSDGAPVVQGQALLVVETSKAALEIEAPCRGCLHISVAEGSSVASGSIVATIEPPTFHNQPSAASEQSARWTRRARAIAEQYGIDPAEIDAPGIVTERHVLAALALRSPTPHGGAHGPIRVAQLSRVQHAVARQVSQSLSTHAHAFVMGSYRVDVSLDFINKTLGSGKFVSLGDLVVFHAARHLREFPRFNAYLENGEVREYEKINVAFAVAADTGLYTPVVPDADRLSLDDLVAEMQHLKLAVLRGTPPARSLAGGTFTVSTLDVEGLSYQLPIINASQSSTLGVGSVRREFVPGENGDPRPASLVGLCLSYDHRLLNGLDAARFLSGLGARLATLPNDAS